MNRGWLDGVRRAGGLRQQTGDDEAGAGLSSETVTCRRVWSCDNGPPKTTKTDYRFCGSAYASAAVMRQCEN